MLSVHLRALFATTQVSIDFECNIASIRKKGRGVKFIDAQTVLGFLFQKKM